MFDILTLTNGEKRMQFLKDHKEEEGWYKWLTIPEIDKVYWRRELGDASIIIDTEKYDLKYPAPHIQMIDRGIYYLPNGNKEGNPLSNYYTTNSDVMKRIQEYQKAQKALKRGN